MVAVGHVEARPRGHEHVLPLEEIEGEGLIVEPGHAARQPLGMHPDESVHRALGRRLERQPAAVADRGEQRGPGGVEPATGPGEFEDRLVAAEGRLHRELAGHVRAQPQRGEQFHRLDVVAGMLPLAREHEPAHPQAAGPVDLAQSRERQTERVAGERGEGRELGAVVEHLVVDLVGTEHEVPPLGDPRERLEHLPRVDGARGVIGVDDHDRPGLVGDETLDLLGIGHVAPLGAAGVVDGLRPVDHHARRPEREVGARHEHLVARIEQGPHRQHDQLGDAVADEHVVGGDVHHAPILLLHHHRLAGREDALLVRVGVGLVEVLDDRHPHRRGHPEAEGAGVADVELDDVVPLPLELLGAAGERPADLVADLVEVFGGSEGREAHGCCSRANGNL